MTRDQAQPDPEYLADVELAALALAAERDQLRADRDFFRDCFDFASRHAAAIHVELGLSCEAETPTVIDAIRKLRQP